MLEMLVSKAATMGVGNGLWRYEFSGHFHNIVTDVSISARRQVARRHCPTGSRRYLQACDVPTPRLSAS